MWIYFLLFRIASLFNTKARKIVRGQAATLRSLKANPPEGRYVWFHAASVGEFEQARPIIERLKRQHPSRKVLLTFFSCSGYELRHDYEYADLVLYLPFATRRNAKRFLASIDIEMAIFVKYEFWPAYLRALRKRAIPTYIIAAIFRPEQLFFHWYGRAYRRLLRCFSFLFVQDDASRDLLAQYGIENVIVAGDTRFDRVSAISADHREMMQLMRFIEPDLSPLTNIYLEQRRVIIAGSTWPADEALLARYMAEHPGIKLVLVPHELTPEHLHDIFNRFQGRFVRFSEATLQNLTTCNMLLVDRMGLLSHIYRYGQVAYVGGGFGEGIHSTLEPAVYGLPVIFGPNNKRFREAQNLIQCGGGIAIHDYPSFAEAMDRALEHHAELGALSAAYVQSELGATERIYHALFD